MGREETSAVGNEVGVCGAKGPHAVRAQQPGQERDLSPSATGSRALLEALAAPHHVILLAKLIVRHLAGEVSKASNPETFPGAMNWLCCLSPRSRLLASTGGVELKGFQGVLELGTGGVGARGRRSLSRTWCLITACRKGRCIGSWPSRVL